MQPGRSATPIFRSTPPPHRAEGSQARRSSSTASADRYTLSGATASRRCTRRRARRRPNPAVSIRNVGTSGGQAAAFTFDLARSVVYTRQGNPAWAGQERDGFAPIRSDDMFFPDWIDFNKVAIPQADEQQRLLANLIEQMNFDRKPLPRFWYFPRDEASCGRHDGGRSRNGEERGAVRQLPRSESRRLLGRLNGNASEGRRTSTPTRQQLAGRPRTTSRKGFEIGEHVDIGCATGPRIPSRPTSPISSPTSPNAFPSVPAPATNRTHCIVLSDWDSQPKVELVSWD